MENKSARAKVQAFGGFLTAMVIPNIGAFIAWGFITALFIPTGWLPNEHFAKIVGPMITYLLPVMIGSTGGHLIGGKRGAVMGGIGTIGVIVGAEIPMFLGSVSYTHLVVRGDATVRQRSVRFRRIWPGNTIASRGISTCVSA